MNTAAAVPAPSTPAAAPSLEAIKARQQAAWSSGDYAIIGTTLQIVGENLCEAADVHAGERVLDVAAGNGNASLAAARRGARVVSSDYVPALLQRGRARAEADGLVIEFREADAEALPFEDGSFDLVLSVFGVMFTPNQEVAAQQLLRVCRRGGRIALASWTPESFVGQMFKVIGAYIPPPAIAAPSLWGTTARIQTLFGAEATSIRAEQRQFTFRYDSPARFLEVFRTFYGPVLKAFAALDAQGQERLAADLLALAARFNRATDGTLAAPSDYLEVVVGRR